MQSKSLCLKYNDPTISPDEINARAPMLADTNECSSVRVTSLTPNPSSDLWHAVPWV